jgi:molybdopterin synthase sulfur carrier subunit
MRVLYFAWLRERIGVHEEELTPPEDVATVDAFLNWLARRGPGYAQALADKRIVRVAVNQKFAEGGDTLRGTDEIALFPPVTGG